MPTIEERALATAVEAAGRRMQDYRVMAEENILRRSIEAHARAIEAHDAERAAHAQFRQEVSDAVERVKSTGHWMHGCMLDRFIIPKPVDPLVEVFREVHKHHAKEGEEWAEAVVRRAHDAAAELGYKLKLVEVGDAD